MSLQSQFQRLLSDIEPSTTTKQRAIAAHTSLRKFLKEHETFKQYLVRIFLSGSYVRDTAIRPRIKNGDEERPDVDIIVVTTHALSDAPAEVVELLYQTLKEGYDDLRFQARSVRLFTKTADMDIVPIIEQTNHWSSATTLYIPDRKLETWLETNPPGHTKWTTEENKASGGRFKPLVKLMKWWRREEGRTRYKKPKGFMLECITAECMDYEETQYADLFLGTLEEIVSRYAIYVQFGIVPTIADPGVPNNSVTSSLEFEAFEAFYNKAKAHAELGRRAQQLQESDPEKALQLWRKIFGERFPAPKSTQKSGSLLGEALVPTGLHFPDRPITDKQNRGFA